MAGNGPTRVPLAPPSAARFRMRALGHGPSPVGTGSGAMWCMIAEAQNTVTVFKAIDAAVEELVHIVNTMNEHTLNTVPYKDGWTAGQLLRHVTKSTMGMAEAMDKRGPQTGRNPGGRIPELKKQFLDFSSKMKSPASIVPEAKHYLKEPAIEQLQGAFEQLKLKAGQAEPDTLVEGLPLGPITKWEILHFVLFHTQRHVHQLTKMNAALHR